MFVIETNVTCARAADIILILDQSTSIVVGDPNYDNWYVQILGFAKRVAGAFPIGENLTQVGVLKFSEEVEIVFHLNTYGDRESLLRAIEYMDINGGETNIAAALRTAREIMFDPANGARPGVPEIIILLTDGTANTEEANTLPEAELTKEANIKVYTIGVTHEVDEDQLREIASTPEYFFFASNFTQLNTVLQSLVENSCKEAATLPTTTSTTTTPSPTTPTTTTPTTTVTTTTRSTTTATTTTPTTTTTIATTPTTTTETTTTPTTTLTTTTISTTTPTTTATTTPTTTTTATSTVQTTTRLTTTGMRQRFCSRLPKTFAVMTTIILTHRHQQLNKPLRYRRETVLRSVLFYTKTSTKR